MEQARLLSRTLLTQRLRHLHAGQLITPLGGRPGGMGMGEQEAAQREYELLRAEITENAEDRLATDTHRPAQTYFLTHFTSDNKANFGQGRH